MSETNKNTGNNTAAISPEIRKYFLPLTKKYYHKLSFYLLYCAFLVIPATAKFLGQFRTGGAFMAIFFSLALIAPWVQYYKSMKTIEQSWPTAEMREALNKGFAESKSIFDGEARIGREYTFLHEEIAIVPTKEVRDILLFRNRAGMLVKAALSDGDVKIAQLPLTKDNVEEMKQLVTEAQDCLKAMKE